MTIQFQSVPPNLVTLTGTNTVSVTGTTAVSITNATIPVTGSVNANITNASITVSGTLDANITNASLNVAGTVNVGTMPDVTIANATLTVAGSVDATLTGPVGISQGSTINVVNSAAGGQTPLSQTTTITTAPDTLDSTNYVLAALPNANRLPAGSSGNLVYDSNLTQAIASVGPTWKVNGTIGTAAGDINVLNAGTDQAEWVVYGALSNVTGTQSESQGFPVLAGEAYTISTNANMTALTAGYLRLGFIEVSSGNLLASVNQNYGSSGLLSVTYTPSTDDVLITQAVLVGATMASGDTVSWTELQVTQTSTVQPYEPGPLWNYLVFKQDGSNYYLLGQTTALAFEDTGQLVGSAQPYSVNTTYPQISSPNAPTITVEGTAGTTTATYGIAAQTSQAQGTVALAANPGVEIGTIDLASGAKVELAAGTAVIGTVNAQGQVDVGTIDTITAGSLSIVNQPGINIPSGSEHNYSMTMTTAGTSYTAAPAVSTRAFFLIQNASGNNLYFGFGSLGNIFELGPLQGYEEASGKNPLITLAITVQGTVSPQKVSIVTWE